MKKSFLILFLLTFISAELFSQSEVELQLKKHVAALTADSLMGRLAGSKGEKMASDYIFKVFKEYGITSLYPSSGQDFSFVSDKGDTIHSQNVIAIIEGVILFLK